MGRRDALMTGLSVTLLALAMLVPAARADLASLKISCQPREATDAQGYTYRFCDDGVPSAGGRTPNHGADRAVAVPAAYAGEDGLPPLDYDRATEIPGNSGGFVHLDVNVTMPDPEKLPPPASGYPLIVLMHGCCSGNKTGWEATALHNPGEKWHYNNAWWASRGYVVLTYTARGFVNGSGGGSTGEMHIDSQQFEINDYQHLAGQLVDDPFFNVDPARVVVTGGSYGGGFTWGALTDPIWRSPGGRRMKLVAAAPKYGWTDLPGTLIPTGRHFYSEGDPPATDGSDSGFSTPTRTARFGIPIRSIIQALFLSGDVGFPSPPPNNNRTTFPESIREAFNCTASTWPLESNPACDEARSGFLVEAYKYSSAYYRNDFFEKVATDPEYRIPVFSAGTFTDPLFPAREHRRMAERLKRAYPGYPITEYYGDYQHFAQNKAKEWGDICGEDRHVCRFEDYAGGDVNAAPANRKRLGTTTMINRFIDHYARPPGNTGETAPAFDVTASLLVCPQNAGEGQPADEPGPTFRAETFDALAPGRLTLDWTNAQPTTHDVEPNTHATQADPLVNTASNGSRCPIHTDPAPVGVAVYESDPLPAQATMLGGSIVSADYTYSGDVTALQLNARLYDVLPDGTAVMVDRGPRRIDPERDGTERVRFQLHGQGWRFAPGHRIRLELMQDDDPYLHVSNSAASMTVAKVRLEVPVREESFGTRNVAGADRTPPKLRVRTRRMSRRRGALVSVRCSESCRGTVVIASGRRNVLARKSFKRAGTVRLKLPPRRTRRVKKVTVTVTARDRAGNAAFVTRRARLRR